MGLQIHPAGFILLPCGTPCDGPTKKLKHRAHSKSFTVRTSSVTGTIPKSKILMAEAFFNTTSTSTVGWKQISPFGLTWHNSICLPTAEHSKKGEKLVMFWMCVWLFFRILYGHPCLWSQLGGRTIDYNHLKSSKQNASNHHATVLLSSTILSIPLSARLHLQLTNWTPSISRI